MSSVLARLRALLMSAIAALSRARHPSSSSGTPPPQPPYLANLVLSGDPTVVVTHTTGAYGILGYDQFGVLFVGTPGPFIYASSNAANATMNSTTGVATGVAAGSSNITCSVVNSLGQTITSNAVTLMVSAQVATTPIAVSPPSVTLASGTQQFTAVVSDQASIPNVMSGASVTWDTDNHAVATVNGSGLLTAVGNGTCTLTATSSSATGTATVTIAASSVTAVSILHNGVTATQLLMRTGTAYTFVAKDQAGNTLTNVGTWSVPGGDATNFPINSTSGVVIPITAASGQGTTFTYTHTATQHTATCTATALLPTTVVVADKATNYTNDAAFMAVIASSVGVTSSFNNNVPTGGGSAKYNDGVKCNQITIDPTRTFMGDRTFLMTFPTGGGPPALRTNASIMGNGYVRMWMMTVKRYDIGFSMLGNGQGGAAAYKDAPWLTWSGPNGRVGIDYTNGLGTDGDIGQDCILASSTQQKQGGADNALLGRIGTAFTDGLWIIDFTLYEQRSANIMSARYWRTKIGQAVGSWQTNSTYAPNGLVEGPMIGNNIIPNAKIVSWFGENFNRGITFNMFKSVALCEAVDGTTYGDPYGILGTQATPTLTGISGGTITQNTTGNTITLTGTNLNDNCYPVFSNSGIKVQSITRTGSTTFTIVANVLSTASSGVGTVAVYNAGSQVATATQPVTVGNLTTPGAPTASNATVVNNQTLTFPVTLNAVGSLPDSLAWQYSTDNVSFTNGTDLPLTSPSLGQVVNQQVALPNPSTLYYVKFAEKNSAGTSSFATSVTGTTGAVASLPSTGLVIDFNADLGLDTTTDLAGVGSLTDQTATGAQLFQGTASKQGILHKNFYGTHSAIVFTAANSQSLTANAIISALNSADGTFYYLGANNISNQVNDGRFFNNLDGTNKQGMLLKMIRSTNTAAVQFGNGSSFPIINLSTSITPASGLHCFSASFNHTTPNTITAFDGTAQGSDTSGFSAAVASPPFFSLGSSTGSSNFGDLIFTRFLFYNIAHTAAQQAQVYSALKAQGYPLP